MKLINKHLSKLTLVLMIALSACGGKKVKIAFNPELNKNYNLDYVTDMKMGMEMMGKTMNINMNIGMESGLTCTKNDGGNKHLSFTYNSMKMEMGQGDMNMSFDSKNPGSAESPQTVVMSKIFNALIGKKIEFDMSSKGEVSNVTGFDAIVKEMATAVDSIPGGASQMESMKSQFGDNQIKQMMSQGFNFYPSKEIGIGDEWETSSNIDMQPMKFQMKSKYKLLSINGDNAKISISGTMSTGGDASKSDIPVNVSIKGAITGNMTVSIATGMPIGSDMKMDLKGSSSAGGQTIPMTMLGTVKLSTK